MSIESLLMSPVLASQTIKITHDGSTLNESSYSVRNRRDKSPVQVSQMVEYMGTEMGGMIAGSANSTEATSRNLQSGGVEVGVESTNGDHGILEFIPADDVHHNVEPFIEILNTAMNLTILQEETLMLSGATSVEELKQFGIGFLDGFLSIFPPVGERDQGHSLAMLADNADLTAPGTEDIASEVENSWQSLISFIHDPNNLPLLYDGGSIPPNLSDENLWGVISGELNAFNQDPVAYMEHMFTTLDATLLDGAIIQDPSLQTFIDNIDTAPDRTMYANDEAYNSALQQYRAGQLEILAEAGTFAMGYAVGVVALNFIPFEEGFGNLSRLLDLNFSEVKAMDAIEKDIPLTTEQAEDLSSGVEKLGLKDFVGQGKPFADDAEAYKTYSDTKKWLQDKVNTTSADAFNTKAFNDEVFLKHFQNFFRDPENIESWMNNPEFGKIELQNDMNYRYTTDKEVLHTATPAGGGGGMPAKNIYTMNVDELNTEIQKTLEEIRVAEQEGRDTSILSKKASQLLDRLEELKTELKEIEATLPDPVPNSPEYKMKDMSDSYLETYAKSYNSYSDMFYQQGNFEKAENYAKEALIAQEELARRRAQT